jgi:hypothetical protein
VDRNGVQLEARDTLVSPVIDTVTRREDGRQQFGGRMRSTGGVEDECAEDLVVEHLDIGFSAWVICIHHEAVLIDSQVTT